MTYTLNNYSLKCILYIITNLVNKQQNNVLENTLQTVYVLQYSLSLLENLKKFKKLKIKIMLVLWHFATKTIVLLPYKTI